MSYHAIENLVEDAVHLIEQTSFPAEEQRYLIYNLYRFQNRFDTSYTVLRCFPFLGQIGFIKKLPIDQHPDFEKHPGYFANQTESGWIYAAVDLADEGDQVYHEDGMFYPEYGSQVWERLATDGKWPEATERPHLMPLPALLAKMIAVAEQQGNVPVMHNFYLAFLNAYLEADLGEADGLPERFDDWVDDPDLLKVRKLFVQHSLLKIGKKETEFDIPRLSSELDFVTAPDSKAKIEFLMNPKKTVGKINDAYLKAQKALEELPKKVEAIGDSAKQEMENHGWVFAAADEQKQGETYKWLWYKDVQLASATTNRIFTEIILEVKLSSVLAKQYVQHGLLLEWQHKPLTTAMTDAHFEVNPFEFIDDENLDKHLNFLGLWVIPFKSKQTAVLNSFRQFLSYLTSLDTTYLDKIDAEFPERFFSKPYSSYIDIFESNKPLPEFLLIGNLYSISLLFIYKLTQEGKTEEALEIHEKQEARFSTRFKQAIDWYHNSYVPYIEAIRAGDKPALPMLYKRN